MNLISAILVHLWMAGWALAAVRAALKARAVRFTTPPGSSR
jgi:hypothetical protein